MRAHQWRLAAGFVLAVAGVVAADWHPPAPIAWGPVKNPTNGHLYYVLDWVGWFDARQAAYDMGGYLAIIDDELENDWVTGTFAGYGERWIGLHRGGSSWEWVDGRPATWPDWAGPEPSLGEAVYIEAGGRDMATWASSWESSRMSAIVEMDADCADPEQPMRMWDFYGLHVRWNGTIYSPCAGWAATPATASWKWPNINVPEGIDGQTGPAVYAWMSEYRAGGECTPYADKSRFKLTWTGYLCPEHSEVYTLIIETGWGRGPDTDLVLSNPDGSVMIGSGCGVEGNSCQLVTPGILQAGTLYPITVRYEQVEPSGYFLLRWSSPSTPLEVVPPKAFRNGWTYTGDDGTYDDAAWAETTIPDCNGNGAPDSCDIANGVSKDCDGNGVPDECELAAHDCNNNGKYDACEVAAGAADCNGNKIPDACDIISGLAECPVTPENACLMNNPQAQADCNGNDVSDLCDIQTGTSADLNGNFVPDECDPDCNGDGIPDDIQLEECTNTPCHYDGQHLHDCDGNAKYDECEVPDAQGGFCTESSCTGSDCDGNGILDRCDISAGRQSDCNGNSIPDLCETRDHLADDCNDNQIPDECEIRPDVDCNHNATPDICEIRQGVLTDCNNNDMPDACELQTVMDEILGIASTSLFRQNRSTKTYQNMFAAYGRPWQPGAYFAHKPGLLPSDEPAAKLRALFSLRTCHNVLDDVKAVLPELFAFEMALGNEAFADAMDSTTGVKDDPGDLYAFQSVPGVNSLLDEELALLRGRTLELDPADASNDGQLYPPYTDGTHMMRAAVYNRLPPNAERGTTSLAYISNYGPGINNNYDATLRYPQGHGDAFGYYLSAAKVYLATFRGNPDAAGDIESQLARQLRAAQAADMEVITGPGDPASWTVPVPYQSVRQMAVAMAARARAALHVVSRTFRRDYCEDSEDSAAEHMLIDADRQRAWGMVDWARRGATGAYLDWAISGQLLPPMADEGGSETQPPLDRIDRGTVSELFELAGVVSEIQEQVDRAGAGLSPLGLVSNVVPFGINAAELGTGTGRSHYGQVRDAALGALNNARGVLAYANDYRDQLRGQREQWDGFVSEIDDNEADFNNRLIEIFGYPSSGDREDNDFDSTTTDQQEAESAPDLVNFALSESRFKERNWPARKAPGEIQLAAAEEDAAVRRVIEAADALALLVARIKDLQDFRRFLTQQRADVDKIVDQYGVVQESLEQTIIKANESSITTQRWIARGIRAVAESGLAAIEGAGLEKLPVGGSIAAAIAKGTSVGMDYWLEELTAEEEENEFQYRQAEAKLDVWAQVRLVQCDVDIRNQEKFLELQGLIRQVPQYERNIATARQQVHEAMRRKLAAIQRGLRLIAERDRVRRIRQNQLQSYRWGDLAYRTFRYNALQKYDAFFDLAARYVMLAGRAYGYEYNSREQAYAVLKSINRERLLGAAAGSTGGLQGIVADLDRLVQVSEMNTPWRDLGQRSFSLRRNLLGLRPGAAGDRAFRAFLEQHTVQALQDLPLMQDYAQLSVASHHGPAIVIPFCSEVAGHNFFGLGPDAPFGVANFPVSLDTKIRYFAVRLDGGDPDSLGIDPSYPYVSIFLMPIGQSVLRENTNAATVEENEPRAWAVVDQWLPAPVLVNAQNPAVQSRYFSPWVSTANNGGNYLNAIKRFRETEAEIELGQPVVLKSDLAGRAVWNTQWVLVIPGKQWTSSPEPAAIRERLLTLIHGPSAEPVDGEGMTDIRVVIQAYAH